MCVCVCVCVCVYEAHVRCASVVYPLVKGGDVDVVLQSLELIDKDLVQL